MASLLPSPHGQRPARPRPLLTFLTATVALMSGGSARAATLEVCATCTYTSIDDAFTAAEAGDELEVAAGEWSIGIALDKDIEIRGAGIGKTVLVPSGSNTSTVRVADGALVDVSDLTVDGGGTARGFHVDAATLRLHGVAIQDGAGVSGAGIWADDGAVVEVEDSLLDGNSAGSAAGGQVVVRTSRFTATRTDFVGGAASSGAGIWADEAVLRLSSCTFRDNVASPGKSTGHGGAIRARDSDVEIASSRFVDNRVDDGGNGGALSSTEGSLSLVDVLITGSSATDGGALYLYDSDVDITDSRIEDNVATGADTGRGGGIFSFGGSLSVSGGGLQRNSVAGATDFAAGGAIYANDVTVTLRELWLRDNTIAGDSSVYGGGLYANDAELSVFGLTATGNHASGDSSGVLGGAIFFRGSGSTATIGDSLLSGNMADYAGGALFTTDGSTAALGSVQLSELVVRDNAAGIGGGLALYGEGLTSLTAVRVQDNSSTGSGAGVYWRPGAKGSRAGSLSISDSRLSGNTTDEYGGGLAALYGQGLELLNVELVGNTAADGGGLYVASVGLVSASHNLICGNTATDDDGGGGSLSSTGDDGTDEWSHNVVADNSAADNGGGLQYYEWLGGLSVVNNSFLGNSTTDNGGGFYGYGSDQLDFVNNLVAWTGGGDGVYLSEVLDTDDIRYGAWYDNSTDDIGGAANDPGTGTVTDAPLLWSYTPGGDCDRQVFSHGPLSPLIDAGDPAILELDGSRSDIGAYGGADSDPDDLVDGDGDGWPGSADCDDDDPDVFPGATEVPYDGVDQDCDGDDACDQDGDGFDSDLCEGDDCDDEAAAVYPGADDPEGDGVDGDCDGVDGIGTGAGGGSGDGGAGDGGADGGAGDGGADGGSGDGGADGGAGDGGADGGSGDGGADGGADGGTADGGADGGASDGGASDGGAGDGGADDGKDGGCGCTAGPSGGSGAALVAGLLLVGLGRRRR